MNIMVAIGSLFLIGGGSQAQVDKAILPADVDPDWLESWQCEIDEQFKMLTEAYGLDEDAQTLLRDELQRRLADQYAYDQMMEARMDDLNARIQAAQPEPDSPEDEAFARELEEIVGRMPLASGEVAGWTEGHVAPPETLIPARNRYQELRFQRERSASLVLTQTHVPLAKSDGEVLHARRGSQAPHSAGGPPKPIASRDAPADFGMGAVAVGDQKLERAYPVVIAGPVSPVEPVPFAGSAPSEQPSEAPAPLPTPPETGAFPRKAAERSKDDDQKPSPPPPVRPPAEPKAATPAGPDPVQRKQLAPAAPPPKAPPLDEWDKFVIQTSEKYGFSDSQITQARGILRDMRQRASQYRLSRAADFDHAEKLADARARKERLDQLNKPLDALFGELKCRVEALPTTAQRQQAAAPAGGKKPAAPSKPASSPKK